MTVSAHAEYNFGGNAMSARNRDAVADLPLSEKAKAYIACNMELDKALESLINKLEAAGIADHTLVVLSADHIPYGDEYRETCDEIAAYQRGISEYHIDPYFERYKNNLIIWTGSMEEGKNVIVDKPCYSMDILPTIANMLVGRDIFSDTEGMVIFPNGSWITETAMYNNSKDARGATSLTGEEVSEDYVSATRKKVATALRISRQFVEMDYYKYLH